MTTLLEARRVTKGLRRGIFIAGATRGARRLLAPLRRLRHAPGLEQRGHRLHSPQVKRPTGGANFSEPCSSTGQRSTGEG